MLLVHSGVAQSRRAPRHKGWREGSEDEAKCAVCQQDCHLAGLECDCSPGRRGTLRSVDMAQQSGTIRGSTAYSGLNRIVLTHDDARDGKLRRAHEGRAAL